MNQAAPPSRSVSDAAIFAIERPHPKLWTYYLLCCVPALVFPPVAIALGLVNRFRYQSMRYRFDAEGIHMRWGLLFRREVVLNYARIQDIHLVSNFVERWLGLARIQIQTASGSATPEMTLEGILEFEPLRDFLYGRMRGIHPAKTAAAPATPPPLGGAMVAPAVAPESVSRVDPELAHLLEAITAELAGLRRELRTGRPPTPNR